ncbi:uncharacterized protein LOC114574607 [Exaiptasia diaphana]|uniref:NACHT domain-containing protein n=1 Tax=Exaiptasia diaphana TaxID=2652724 RepID=A0A913YEM2_EXADI|nr:uncharacterized protein LOC114574607 [Exaiptasia diaphana]
MQMQSTPKTLLDNFKTDDIFTHVILHHDNSKSHDMNNCEEALHDGKCKMMSNWANAFRDKTEKSKSILLVGQRGIGKTLFTKKLIDDWSQDGGVFGKAGEEDLVNGVCKLGYLMSVEELNSFEEKEFSLVDLLKHVTGVSKNSERTTLVEQLIQNPENLLLAFDDFDEFKDLVQCMDSNLESTFPDDPNTKMPLSLLINRCCTFAKVN